MSSERVQTTLGDVCLKITDGAHASPRTVVSGKPMASVKDLTRFGVDLTSARLIPIEDFDALVKQGCKPEVGDVLIAKDGNSALDTVCTVSSPLDAVLLSSVAILRPNPEKINSDFLKFYLSSADVVSYLKSTFISGAAIPRVVLRDFKKAEIDIPPLSIQKKIVSVLNALENRILVLRETNATLEAIAQALFKSWFVDFDAVRAKLNGRSPEGMDEATAALFPDSVEETELGLVPLGWRYVSLREAVSIHDSKRIPLSGQERDKRKGPYPYYGAAALMDAVDDYIFDGVYLLTGEDGSVADTNGYPIMQYVWGKFWVNNHAHILQGKDGVSTEHVMLAMQRVNITPYITGAVQAKLSQTNMWRINFLMPTREVSEKFGSLLEPLFARFRQNSEQAQTLSNLRDALLPRLISGQLRLPTLVEAD
jgi:type I restriction enzyme S subunit